MTSTSRSSVDVMCTEKYFCAESFMFKSTVWEQKSDTFLTFGRRLL